MKKFTLILLCIVHCTLCINLTAQVECKTIAEIKSQPDKTKILYTGTATTTFYNGTYNGLFMEDETGGILLKGYTLNGKKSDWVTDSMEVTNITATWSVGSTGTTPGITVANADKLTEWINTVHSKTELINTDFRPVPLRYFYFDSSGARVDNATVNINGSTCTFDENGEVAEYLEAEDGAGYTESVKKI